MLLTTSILRGVFSSLTTGVVTYIVCSPKLRREMEIRRMREKINRIMDDKERNLLSNMVCDTEPII